MSANFDVEAVIAGRRIPWPELLAWEDRRIDVSAAKLGVAVPAAADVATRRAALVDMKMNLGADAILQRFAGQLSQADRIGRLAATLTSGRAFVTAELNITGGSGAHLVQWFDAQVQGDEQAAMVAACPDHYVLRTGVDGVQQVVQATGASPMLNQFFLTYGSEVGLANPRAPGYANEIVASAQLLDGTLVGGARMQFRDTTRGFFARLIEEFPRSTPPNMIRQQRWHTATEFANWARAAHAS